MDSSVAFVHQSQQRQGGDQVPGAMSDVQGEREAIPAGLQGPSKWTYRTKEQLEQSPSILDGLDMVKQARWRREYLHLIYKAGSYLKVPPWGLATAALLCHRFFSLKSMKKNDRFVIATACLHLGAKLQEAPKSIRDVVKECEKIRHAKNVAVSKRLNDTAYLEDCKEQILMAERAVLYTLGFDLDIQHPHSHMVRFFGELDMPAVGGQSSIQSDFKDLFQNAWNFVNDSFRTTLCLQYPPEKLAAATIWMANDINKRQSGKDLTELIREKTKDKGQSFFGYFKITTAEVKDISDQILSLYEDLKSKPESPSINDNPESEFNLVQPRQKQQKTSQAPSSTSTPQLMPPTPLTTGHAASGGVSPVPQ